MNCSIKETIDLLEKTRQELQTKQGELAVKNSKLINVETEVTLLQFRKSIFQAQKQEIVEATAALGDNHVRSCILFVVLFALVFNILS